MTTGTAINRLLDALPLRQRAGVLAQCESVSLAGDATLWRTGEPFKHAYFPTSGSISLLSSVPGHPAFETGSIGAEGMLGLPLILGVKHAYQRALVRTPSLALRLSSGRIKRLLDAHPAFLTLLQRYQCTVMEDLSRTVVCVRFHDVRSRLARSLLIFDDRSQHHELPLLTHGVLADILGVQRGSVTIAATRLQREGIIHYRRGRIDIVSRERLQAASCDCYGAGIRAYESLLV